MTDSRITTGTGLPPEPQRLTAEREAVIRRALATLPLFGPWVIDDLSILHSDLTLLLAEIDFLRARQLGGCRWPSEGAEKCQCPRCEQDRTVDALRAENKALAEQLAQAKAELPGKGLTNEQCRLFRIDRKALLRAIGPAGSGIGMNAFGVEHGRLIAFVDGVGDVEPTQAEAEALTFVTPMLWKADAEIEQLRADRDRLAGDAGCA